MPRQLIAKKRLAKVTLEKTGMIKRATRHPLSRQRILEAAVAIIDRDGLDALSMRQLGRTLGVKAMSLYYYFKSRDELLDGAVEAIMEEIVHTVNIKKSNSQSWQSATRNFINAYRVVGKKRPNRFHLVTQRPLKTAAAKKVGRVLADALLSSGLETDAAMIAYRAVTCFAAGFVLLENSGKRPAYTMGNLDIEFERSVDIILCGIESAYL